jgi:prepilin peptidase CpaA
MPIGLWDEGIAVLAGLVACGIDLKWRKIPNWLTLSVLVIGLGGHAVSGWRDGLNALGGCCAGLTLLLIPFVSGGIGGGDVKLMMALGALLGTGRIFWVFIYAGIAGGVFSLFYLGYRLGIFGTFLRLRSLLAVLIGRKKRDGCFLMGSGQPLRIPYGVAICCGLGWEILSKIS